VIAEAWLVFEQCLAPRRPGFGLANLPAILDIGLAGLLYGLSHRDLQADTAANAAAQLVTNATNIRLLPPWRKSFGANPI
jgi:hypothetical protein